ncbi:MAG: ATP-binding protein [Balneolaceae bacterium]|nr:ATP-binding protein [Balneolaceae bacterium]
MMNLKRGKYFLIHRPNCGQVPAKTIGGAGPLRIAEMDPKTLKESESVEFKEQFNDSALKTLAAFVNAKGGSLYVGIKDDVTLLSEGITDENCWTKD